MLAVGFVAEKVGLELAFGGLVLSASPVGVGSGKIEKKGLFTLHGDEILCLFGHFDRVSLASL